MRAVRIGLVSGVIVTALAGQPAAAATLGFENSLLNVGGTSTFGADGVRIDEGRIDRVGIEGVFAVDVQGACGGVGCLTLDTGDFLGTSGSDPNIYRYSGDGAFVRVEGTAMTPGADQPSGVLFESLFDQNHEIILTFDVLNGTRQSTASLQGALASGTINLSLASFFGISSQTSTGVFNSLVMNLHGLTFTGAGGLPQGTGGVGRNDIVTDVGDAPQPQLPVPEPGSLLLLGTGLLVAARTVRRRRQ